MRKTLIIISIVILSGCSTKRFAVNNYGIPQSSTEELIKKVRDNNLSKEGFFIEKGSLSFKINGEAQKYLFSVKFSKPESFLFSLKSSTGIEGARILVTGDTLLINDRIGKRVLYGEADEIENKTGIPAGMIGVLFGDLPEIKGKEKTGIGSSPNEIIVIQTIGKDLLRSVVSREKEKVVSLSFSSSYPAKGRINDSISIKYSKFVRRGVIIPTIIELTDVSRNIKARIKIEKIRLPWEGELAFISGKGFKTERIK